MIFQKKQFLYLFPILLFWHTLLFYGIPFEIQLLLLFLLIALCFLYKLAEISLITFSFLFITLILEVFLRVTGLGTSMFFRPTEMLRIGNNEFGYVYQPNRDMKMNSPYGDLEATMGVNINEPREIEFVTDNLGFRNTKSYTDQKFFLVGDSFAMGEGSTQNCVITEVMRSKYQQNIYNLAHSGNQPWDYLNHIESFVKLNPSHPKAIVMFFEGNDFERYEYHSYGTNINHPYQDFFKTTNVFRYTRWLYLRATKPKEKDGGPIVKKINGHLIGFSSWYEYNVKRKEPLSEEYMQWSKFFNRLDGEISLVIFVPDKYRVYGPLLDEPETNPLPNRNWEYLQSLAIEHKIPTLNLTQPLFEKAKKEKDNDNFVFWLGDTHWNCEGMATAAFELNNVLKSFN